MPTYTPKWNLEKPDRGQLDWDLPINANFDKLDKAVYQALNAHTGDNDYDEELPLPDLPNRVLWLYDSTNNMWVEIHQVYIPYFISEGFSQPALNGLLLGGFWIDKYQCCHPKATRFSRGTDTPNSPGTVAAASKPHVVPWTNINWWNAKTAVENRNLITGEKATGYVLTYKTQEMSVTGEAVGTGDGSTTEFLLDFYPVKSGSLTVYVDGVAKTEGTDYTVDYNTGKITFTTAPAAGASITADYIYYKGSKSEFYVQTIEHLVGRIVRIVQNGVTYHRRVIKQGIDTSSDSLGARYIKVFPPLPSEIRGSGENTVRTESQSYEIVGHHLVTAYEWFSVAAWAVKYRYRFGFGFPKGNNNWGKDYRDPREQRYEGIPDPVRPGYNGNDIARVLTGSGPLSWSLNGRRSGVWDLNGNVWEWVDLLIGSETDFVISQGYPGEGHLLPTTGTTSGASMWVAELEDSSQELAELGIPKTLSSTPNPELDDMRYWLDETRTGERAALRGGAWGYGSRAGVFSLSLNGAPSDTWGDVGFRGAF